ncbi:Serine phosphatase RsbU, regulator of sigma subunit [hydrothermal vent metagenome]|uniref:Serine phosphatase RsbU, regulator of sigma subunit n=1 Tax=hydrothermal vent metagenome TaxID=652676 RepID=A0A3B1BIL7_9ZZZZ
MGESLMSVPREDISINSNSPKNSRGCALVVDDDITNRLVLASFLKKEGFDIIEAENGKLALELYSEHKPDIIFMDIMMPVMDGLESTKHIRAIDNNDFVPIIFVTAMTDSDTITHCIDAGGDDFLTKPINHINLQAKIHSMERIRDMHRSITELNKKAYHEQKVAEHIFTDVVGKLNVKIEQIHTLIRPLELFSGDMLLTAFTPSRDIHILLADFTGHGLSAAIGALPVSETFHAMTAKGYDIDEILKNINIKLKKLLPTNMFMTAQYVSINHKLNYITACNCAMPDILVLDKSANRLKEKIISRGMPLGIDAEFDFSKIVEYFKITNGDRIFLSSDGIIESTNTKGEEFGEQGFKNALLSARSTNNTQSFFDDVVKKFDAFCKDSPPSDDISLVEILCVPENIPPWDMLSLLSSDESDFSEGASPLDNKVIDHNSTEISINLNSNNLKNTDPVPLVINNIIQLSASDIPKQSLFIILTELYINALDHGILDLDSKLKSSATGFEKYFSEREKRLNNLNSGYVRMSFQIQNYASGGEFSLIFEDSGNGFNFEEYNNRTTDENAFSGRGISLIKQLCKSITYYTPGNKVEVIFQW